MPAEQEKLTIKYLGEPNFIDAETFISSLSHIAFLIQEITDEAAPYRKAKINIQAFERGSFIVDLAIGAKGVISSIKSIFGIDFNAREILSFLIDLLNLKKLLKGEKPIKVHEASQGVVITNNSNSAITVNKSVFNIYCQNAKANDAIEKTFEALDEDDSLDGIALETVQRSLKIERRDFPAMAAGNKLFEEAMRETMVSDAKVSILKVVFDPKRKWEFIYNGVKISAYMDDPSYKKSIEEGRVRFGKGDRLLVDILIHQLRDPSSGAWLNKEYHITKVKEHNSAPKQDTLPF